ncbi:MAG: hypothetical protein GF364_06010 [Candidatus Lokiarchaeota archaeon]|nr:hypothetical protein [Candidatus Lokiarchaeota archaeon]
MSTKDKKKTEIPKLEGSPEDIICNGCSLLCDDIFVEIGEKGNLIRTVNSCFRGNEVLNIINDERRIDSPIQKQMGLVMHLSMNESLDIIGDELKKAKTISFYGLGAISNSQQLSVLHYIKKLLDADKKVYIRSLSNILRIGTELGLPFTTIGQAINVGDVFMFWKTDPTHSHPKLTGKIVFSRGLYRSTGKEVKRFVLIERQESDLTKLNDILINSSEFTDQEFISNINKLIEAEDAKFDFKGVKPSELKELKNYIESAEYGVLVTTVPFDPNKAEKWLMTINQLIKALNRGSKGRYMILPLTQTSNELGLCYNLSSTFSQEDVKKLTTKPDNASDLAVIFGAEYLHDEYAIEDLDFDEKKKILFDNIPSKHSRHALITIPYAIPGIEIEDTIVRLDGINLELKKWAEAPGEVWSIEKIFNSINEK